MGLLTNKDNELNAGKALEDMMDKFNIDIDDLTENVDNNNDDINKRRKEKEEREKLEY